MSLLRFRVRLLRHAVLPARWWDVDGPCGAAWRKGYEQGLELAGLTPDDVDMQLVGTDEDGVGIVETRLKGRAARRLSRLAEEIAARPEEER